MNKRERSSVETLGRYKYDSKERLGYGAFAIVFKGWMKDVKKASIEVAIKIIAKKNLAKSQSLLDTEIKILKALTELQHQNVVLRLECIIVVCENYLCNYSENGNSNENSDS